MQRLLGEFFQEFYRRLMELRNLVLHTDRGTVLAIKSTLTGLFREQLALASKDTQLARTCCTRAHYAMTAYADEFFATLEWSGAGEWRGALLEEQLFGTHCAGTTIFEEIDTLLQQDRDPEMARLYLHLLGLGFTGKYRKAPEPLQALKKKLFYQVYGKHAIEHKEEACPLRVVVENQPKDSNWWWYVDLRRVVIGVVGYLLVTHILWKWAVSGL
jgi:type IV/VI secretion system ImpK/VasF family protein